GRPPSASRMPRRRRLNCSPTTDGRFLPRRATTYLRSGVARRDRPAAHVLFLVRSHIFLGNVEGAEMKFFGDAVIAIRQFDKREGCVGKLLPNADVVGRDREPAEGDHIAPRLRHSPGLLPRELADHRKTPTRGYGYKSTYTRGTAGEHRRNHRLRENPQSTDNRRVAGVASAVCTGVPWGCVTGSCSTVTRCPSQSRVTSTWLPSGNSIAS